MLLRAISKLGEAASLDVLSTASHDDAVLNFRCQSGATALHYAAAAGYATLCRELLEMPEFFVVNEQDSQGCTALHYACSKGHLAACEVLLEHPRFTAQNLQDWNGWTALHAAAAHGRKDLCSAVLQSPRFKAAAARDKDGMTALHFATSRGHGEICQELLSHEAYEGRSHVDHFGRTVHGLSRLEPVPAEQVVPLAVRKPPPVSPKPKPPTPKAPTVSLQSLMHWTSKLQQVTPEAPTAVEEMADESQIDDTGDESEGPSRKVRRSSAEAEGGAASGFEEGEWSGEDEEEEEDLSELADAPTKRTKRKVRPGRGGAVYAQAVRGEEGAEMEEMDGEMEATRSPQARGLASEKGTTRKVRAGRRGVDMYGQAVRGEDGEVGNAGQEAEDLDAAGSPQARGLSPENGGMRKVRAGRRGVDMYGQAVRGEDGAVGNAGGEPEDLDGEMDAVALNQARNLSPENGGMRKVRAGRRGVDMYGQAVRGEDGAEGNAGQEAEDLDGEMEVSLPSQGPGMTPQTATTRKVRPGRPGVDMYGQAVRAEDGPIEDVIGQDGGTDGSMSQMNATHSVLPDAGSGALSSAAGMEDVEDVDQAKTMAAKQPRAVVGSGVSPKVDDAPVDAHLTTAGAPAGDQPAEPVVASPEEVVSNDAIGDGKDEAVEDPKKLPSIFAMAMIKVALLRWQKHVRPKLHARHRRAKREKLGRNRGIEPKKLRNRAVSTAAPVAVPAQDVAAETQEVEKEEPPADTITAAPAAEETADPASKVEEEGQKEEEPKEEVAEAPAEPEQTEPAEPVPKPVEVAEQKEELAAPEPPAEVVEAEDPVEEPPKLPDPPEQELTKEEQIEDVVTQADPAPAIEPEQDGHAAENQGSGDEAEAEAAKAKKKKKKIPSKETPAAPKKKGKAKAGTTIQVNGLVMRA